MQQKPQAEAIASDHAEQKVSAEFDKKLDTVLINARKKYEEEIRNPLIRWGIFPDALRFCSTTDEATVAAKFAKPYQLGAPSGPPAKSPQNDITAQIHETFIANILLSFLLKDSILDDSSEESFPKFSGGQASTLLNQFSTQNLASNNNERIRSRSNLAPQAHKRISTGFDNEAPATIRIEDGKFVVRIRTANIELGGLTLPNLDLLATYRALPVGKAMLLKRDGEIELVPGGFDPQNPRPLTEGEREMISELTPIINQQLGYLLPVEFRIETPDLPRLGKLNINEIRLERGWLTIGLVMSQSF
jgi:hypothetical protein